MMETVNSRISTDVSASLVLDALSEQLTKMQATLERGESSLRATNPKMDGNGGSEAATSIDLTLTKTSDGWLVNADIETKYKPGAHTAFNGVMILVGLFFHLPIITIFSIGLLVVRPAILIPRRGKQVVQKIVDCLEVVKNQLLVTPAIQPSDDFRKCPTCAEMVRKEAIKCRFCHADLAPSTL
jgi:hypothetical protein